jgi:3-deoxy-D-manno-octulosonate 8-phosphate phosphatase (KDO 8-P phosphatase)
MIAPDEVKARCAAIELLVMDVDGVLTDGVIALDDRGVELKHFYVRDGSALALWRRAGKRAAILSGRSARCVERRAAELGIASVIQGRPEKAGPFRALLADLGLEPPQVGFLGDDLPDLPVLLSAGLAACPADAVPEVRAACHVVTAAPAGRGAVREVVELILRHQGAWDRLIAPFFQPALPAPNSAAERQPRNSPTLQ